MMPKDGCESACLFFAKKISNNKKGLRRAAAPRGPLLGYLFVSVMRSTLYDFNHIVFYSKYNAVFLVNPDTPKSS